MIYLQLVINLDGVTHVLLVWSYLRNPLLEVEDVNSELGSLRTWGSKQLSGVLHEGLICLEQYSVFSIHSPSTPLTCIAESLGNRW